MNEQYKTDYFTEAFMTIEDWGRRIRMSNDELMTTKIKLGQPRNSLKQSLLQIVHELDNKATNHQGMTYPGSIRDQWEYTLARRIEKLVYEAQD